MCGSECSASLSVPVRIRHVRVAWQDQGQPPEKSDAPAPGRACVPLGAMKRDPRVAIGAPVAGLLLGVLDFVWIRFVPFPFAALGNSAAVWAVAAFLFGYWIRSGWLRAALAGATLLVIAVPSYYLAAVLIQHDDWASIWALSSWVWMGLGVVAGLLFGAAGVWARDVGWRHTVAVAIPVAVLFAEAITLLRQIGDPNYGTKPLWPAVIEVLFGVLLVALLARGPRPRLTALGLAVPLALLGWASFAVASVV
jgi:hypothetical protein